MAKQRSAQYTRNLATVRYWSKVSGYTPPQAWGKYSPTEIGRRANNLRRLKKEHRSYKSIKNKELRRGKAATPEKRIIVAQRIETDIKKHVIKQVTVGKIEREQKGKKVQRDLSRQEIQADYIEASQFFGGVYNKYTVVINGEYESFGEEGDSGTGTSEKSGTKAFVVFREDLERALQEPDATSFANALTMEIWTHVYWVSLRPANDAKKEE